MFERTYVVTSASKAQGLERDLPEHVGIITLSRDYTLQTVREATTDWDLIDPIAISRTMTIPEACAALEHLDIPAPNVPNMLIRRALDETFKGLGAQICSRAFISTVRISRKPRVTQANITRVPRPLRSFAVSHLQKADELTMILQRLGTTPTQSKEGL